MVESWTLELLNLESKGNETSVTPTSTFSSQIEFQRLAHNSTCINVMVMKNK